MDKAAAWLKATFNYEFRNPEYLRQALTHRSAPGANNERLEFLGDAVLETVVSRVVYQACPDASEGDLSRLRSALVKDATLAELAGRFDIGRWIILGPGEKKSGGHRRASILADAVEAIFGAVYLDAGFDAASDVIHRAYGNRFVDLPDPDELRDPKTRLQEFLQSRKLELPVYEIFDVTGKAHKQTFTVACMVAALDLKTTGAGGSRRDAEQVAAAEMLQRLRDERP